MKFLMTYTCNPNAAPMTPEQMAVLVKYTEDSLASGTVIMTGGIVRPTKGTKLRLVDGKLSVTDGPFPETKELIDGYAIINAASHEQAIERAAEFMKIPGEGTCEILRLFEGHEVPR
jgi:hypothetical protein